MICYFFYCTFLFAACYFNYFNLKIFGKYKLYFVKNAMLNGAIESEGIVLKFQLSMGFNSFLVLLIYEVFKSTFQWPSSIQNHQKVLSNNQQPPFPFLF